MTDSVKKETERDYLFDNYKVFLIILVVIGHFIEPCYENNEFLYELKWAIVAVHMPAFIFISGYFSKKNPDIKKLFTTIAIPYFVYEVIYYLLYTLILNRDTKLYLAWPKFSLWYLMALFFWRILAPYVRKIPYYFPISIVAGLLIGLTEFDNFLSIPRIVFFFPFFLAGMNFDQEKMKRLRNKVGYGSALAVLTAFVCFLYFDHNHDQLSPKIFYGRYSYTDLHLTDLEGILLRILCYAISFVLVYMFMLVLPREKKSYSYLGKCTMGIYIFHGLIYSCLKYGTSVLSSVESNLESMALLAFCFGLVWFLSLKPFQTITNRISHLFST